MKVFPTRLYFFEKLDADIDRRTISGGTSIDGEEDLVATDGGGRVFAEFDNADLSEPDVARSFKAVSVVADGGAEPFIIPLGVAEYQGFGEITTPINGLPWWSEADFADTDPHASLTADAALRATTLSIDVSELLAPVRESIWLSIDHATWRHRAYRIAEVVSDDGTTAVVKIRPPLREATTSGTAVEFYDPKCVMRVDGDMRSPVTLGYAEGSVRFTEWPGAVE